MGLDFVVVDATASRDALRMLIRQSETARVPTVVAYGEVMVGFDEDRLTEMLEGLQERADAFHAEDESQKQQMVDSAISLKELTADDIDTSTPEIDGIDQLPEKYDY